MGSLPKKGYNIDVVCYCQKRSKKVKPLRFVIVKKGGSSAFHP